MSQAKIAKKGQAIEYARKAGHLGPSAVDALAAEERRRHDEYLARREKRDRE